MLLFILLNGALHGKDITAHCHGLRALYHKTKMKGSTTMKNINWNELTPACYAIANANDVDLGVGGSMVHNNIRHGRAVDIGAENLPVAFRPDWAALGADADLAAENDEFNAWIRKRQGNVKALAALWNAKDYQGMIELMENAADPGPINGEKPSDHE